MSHDELLEQFIAEARECLELVGQRLLDVEREPGNADLLNDLFRLVHTLKGNCGLFDFKALERMVHAGEDLLDSIRSHRLPYTATIADLLLETTDYAGQLIEAIEASGALPGGCEARAQTLADALRAQLRTADAIGTDGERAGAPGGASRSVAGAMPAWVDRLAGRAGPGQTALRYVPESDCFFKGEDPWRLARDTPGLVALDVGSVTAWPALADLDCFACNLDFVLLSDAEPGELAAHFRYVPEQIVLWTAPEADTAADLQALAGATAPVAAIERRAAELWSQQRALLGRDDLTPMGLASARRVLLSLQAGRGAGGSAASPKTIPHDRAGLHAWSASAGPDASGRWPTPGVEAARGVPASVAGAEPAAAQDRGARVLKVAPEKIDRLMELIGEMVVAKNALPYLAGRAEQVYQQRELAREIKAHHAIINRVAEDLQQAVMQVRMLPVGTIFQRFHRLVRDISRKLGKEVELVIAGEDTEADKNVIESLADPLIHILRNSLDHGIELPAVRTAQGKRPRATLRVEARQEGDQVILEIGDDGAGIDVRRVRDKAVERGLMTAERASGLSDADAVQLVFLPGFSTAETISDLSGRGVGMDAVRSAVERNGGTVTLSSRVGHGTLVRLALPLSMSINQVMLVEVAGRRFGVPMDLVAETARLPGEDIHTFKTAQTAVLRGQIVPLRAMQRLLDLDGQPRSNADGELAVLVIRNGGQLVGLLVDEFLGTADILLKPLEGVLAGLTGFAGTALLGDGSVLMILNPRELL